MKYLNTPPIFSNRFVLSFLSFFKNHYVQKIFLITFFFLLQVWVDFFFLNQVLVLVLPLFLYFIVSEEKFVSFSFFLYIAFLFESYVFLPFGFYFCSYFSIWLVISSMRDSISWQNSFTLLLVSLSVQLWITLMNFFLILSKNLVTIEALSELFFSFVMNSLFSFFFFLFLLSRDFLVVRHMR